MTFYVLNLLFIAAHSDSFIFTVYLPFLLSRTLLIVDQDMYFFKVIFTVLLLCTRIAYGYLFEALQQYVHR